MCKVPLSSLPQMLPDTSSIQCSREGEEEGNMPAMKMNREAKIMHHTSTRPALILLAINTFLWVFFCLSSLSPITLSLLILANAVAFRHQES